MHEIKCPCCGTVFSVDDTGYAQIAQQVRDEQFEKELLRREKELAERQKGELEVARMRQEKLFEASLGQKDAELSERDRQISELNSKLEALEQQRELAVSNAVMKKEREMNDSLSRKNGELEAKDLEILKLKNELERGESEKQLAVSRALEKKSQELSEKSNELTELRGRLSSQENESKLREQTLKARYDDALRLKDEQIQYYKDFKARQSTKMIGESLERHCQTEFDRIRMAAFPSAYFEKDNDARTGSKGDFIFRETAPDGTELISIMFEMKNEMDETATKHKNEDFFRELDRDRREKKCEYAVLVSMLESDNDLYNAGIVDVSYRYEKMYVVRPQCFIPIITILRNAALSSLKYRQELEVVKNQQIDILNFEANMNAFKDGFARNYRIASEKFKTAIDEIDKTISHLQKTKEALLSSENNLRLANNKADELSIKRLTKNAPSVRQMFDEAKGQ